ncbi:probable iron uptake ABC transporter periplasmic solute-binding protein [Pseudooceanicola batsensis HTCC2597]|uniref:Probable iron uptake ABC transporter periplasmic solute-binding protein n=1 Tax=Pseudooceanicola batsensis (strain ATCC BAA-863 / DSM 15984 / KCTC 12145 / HTCC2597) TaxID=252305 RepID=A3U1G6_PSEBH|nr:ABC transporter substrate-binding protein [Pseudooceanicola batsensis]EAQ02149.1 probable iron uptake ABC transporter periplasmic solute-binding protein [Pseudooceanicola batsensis HTCC2597]
MITWTRLTAASLVALGLAAPAVADEITVYTALEEEEIAAYVEAAQKAMPDTEINVLRLSTGKLGARLLAEAGNPQADLIWGWAVSAMMDPQILDMLEPYAAEGVDVLPATFRGEDGKWFAPIGYMGAFCVNTARLEEKGLPMPSSWEDLEDPAFKGEILMPDPNSSGTGYLHVNAVLQSMGEEAGWAQLEAVDPNMAQYTSSGSKPCKSARVGEYTVGISLAFTAMQSVEEGYPLAMVFPEGGVGYELEASGLMASSDNKEAAKAFLDWTMSDDAIDLYQQYKALITIPGVDASQAAEDAGLPADISTILADIDFVEAAGNQDAVKQTWKDKFGR